jgi:hypothetical protein
LDKAARDLTILTHVYDFLLWLIPATGRFPKNQRYLLGERLENLLLDVLNLLMLKTGGPQDGGT